MSGAAVPPPAQLEGTASLVVYGGALLILLLSGGGILVQQWSTGGNSSRGGSPRTTNDDAARQVHTPGDELHPLSQFRYRYRDILREQVRLRLVYDHHVPPDEADRMLRDGTWTTDDLAASVLDESDSQPSTRSRLAALLGRPREEDRELRRAVAAVAALDTAADLPASVDGIGGARGAEDG